MRVGITNRGTDNNRGKKVTVLTIAVLLLIILAGGTYAWFHMVDALNKFEEEIKSAVLHDDYDKDRIDQDGYTDEYEYNKDVYVENTGGTSLFVRIRLDEYMEIGGVPVVPEAKREDKKTWTPHEYVQSDAEDCGREFHDWWLWDMGGGEQLYTPSQEGVKNIVADRYEGGTDGLDKSDSNNGKTPANTPVFLSKYLEFSEEEQGKYTGWLLDETDGWAYWSQKLESKEATGLLLDRVTMNGSITDTYYYAINVVMEAVDETDVMTWVYGGVPKEPLTTEDGEAVVRASKDAQKFLKERSDSFVKITADMSGTIPSADEFDIRPDGEGGRGDGYLDPDEFEAYLKAVEEARVSGTVLKKLSVEVMDASKMTYEYGDPFNRDAIKVIATYEYKDMTREVTDYTLELDESALEMDELKPMKSANTADNVPVSLDIVYSETGADGKTRTEKTTLTGLTVTNPLDGITLDTANVKTDFYTGLSFNHTGLKVYMKYKSGYKGAEIQLADCNITAPDMSAPGPKDVTVEYDGDRGFYQINVKDFDLQDLIKGVQLYDRIDIPIEGYVASESGTATRTDTDGSKSSVTWTEGVQVTDVITWIVIAVGTDERSDKEIVELVTEEMLTGQQFFTKDSYDWSTSTVRTYLTTTFKEMLPQQMQEDILQVEKQTAKAYDDATMNPTEETIYLLSEEEVKALWPEEDTAGRTCAHYNKRAMDGTSITTDRWWLRSPGTLVKTARNVHCSSGTYDISNATYTYAVRPALTIEVK